MRLKGNHHTTCFPLSRPAHDFLQHPHLGEMHPNKIPHADYRRPKPCWNLIEFAKNLHASLGGTINTWGTTVPGCPRAAGPVLNSNLELQLHSVGSQLHIR